MAGQGYLHPRLGFAVVVPDAASLLEESDTRAVFAVAGEGFERPAIVTVELQAIEPGWDSQTFADEALAAQAAVLGRLRVIDREGLQIDGLPAARVVLQRRDDAARSWSRTSGGSRSRAAAGSSPPTARSPPTRRCHRCSRPPRRASSLPPR